MAKTKLSSDVKETLEILKQQEKFPIMIPFDPLNVEDVFTVSINGAIYAIPRGQLIDVPRDVFKVAQESLVKTMKVQASIREPKPEEIKEV